MTTLCKTCGSYAINHHCHGRDGSDHDLCDVCYWRKRAGVADEIKGKHMSGYSTYKLSLKLEATGKTSIEVSGTISESAKDEILKALMRDDRERICAASIKETWDEWQEDSEKMTREVNILINALEI